eukprot:471443_1
MTRFMIEKLKQESKESYYVILGYLFYSLPDPISLQILWESIHILRSQQPDKLNSLCLKIHAGSIFKPSTDLSIAGFFSLLSNKDIVEATTWTEHSKYFEKMASENITQIKSHHMMYVLLNIPLPNHQSRCLMQLAQEGSRVEFLNTERISSIINHMYRAGNLKPNDMIQSTHTQFSDMLETLVFYPFKFYLSPSGYHWVNGVLYVEYLLMLFVYAYLWPRIQVQTDDTPFLRSFQMVFWVSNLGYVLFECYEYNERGIKQYFNLAAMGDANVMDALVSVIWILLFGLRIGMVHGLEDWTSDKETSQVVKVYTFLFGVQIFLITIRSLKIFNNSQYFGSLVRIIKLMLAEAIKFAFIYFLTMIAILFGLWIISSVSSENVDDDRTQFWEYGIMYGLLYVFEIFIGTKEISEFELSSLGTIYLVIASFFGFLLLFNLLIALMASK